GDERGGAEHRDELQYGQVTVADSLQHQGSDARVVEDALHDYHATDQPGDVDGDDVEGGQQRVGQRVPEQHARAGESTDPGEGHVFAGHHVDDAGSHHPDD